MVKQLFNCCSIPWVSLGKAIEYSMEICSNQSGHWGNLHKCIPQELEWYLTLLTSKGGCIIFFTYIKSFFHFFVSLFSDICKHCKLANKIACNIFSAQQLKLYSFHIKYTRCDWTICSSGFKGEFLFTNLSKNRRENRNNYVLFSERKMFYS